MVDLSVTNDAEKSASNRPTFLPPSGFNDLHELAEILEALGLHLHAKNRIALGESGYYWHLAETLRKLGRMTTLGQDVPALEEKFGSADTQSGLAHNESTRRFLALLL